MPLPKHAALLPEDTVGRASVEATLEVASLVPGVTISKLSGTARVTPSWAGYVSSPAVSTATLPTDIAIALEVGEAVIVGVRVGLVEGDHETDGVTLEDASPVMVGVIEELGLMEDDTDDETDGLGVRVGVRDKVAMRELLRVGLAVADEVGVTEGDKEGDGATLGYLEVVL